MCFSYGFIWVNCSFINVSETHSVPVRLLSAVLDAGRTALNCKI